MTQLIIYHGIKIKDSKFDQCFHSMCYGFESPHYGIGNWRVFIFVDKIGEVKGRETI